MSGGNAQGADAESDGLKEAKSETTPSDGVQSGQSAQPHNIMADVIARHEAAVYRLKKQ